MEGRIVRTVIVPVHTTVLYTLYETIGSCDRSPFYRLAAAASVGSAGAGDGGVYSGGRSFVPAGLESSCPTTGALGARTLPYYVFRTVAECSGVPVISNVIVIRSLSSVISSTIFAQCACVAFFVFRPLLCVRDHGGGVENGRQANVRRGRPRPARLDPFGHGGVEVARTARQPAQCRGGSRQSAAPGKPSGPG